MATAETQLLDDILDRGRRQLLTLGGMALAGAAAGVARPASAQTTSYTNNDILNFALNLEFLEANFYYLSAFGCTIDKPNNAALAAGAPTGGIPIIGSVGTAGTVSGGSQVPFTTITAGSYATETAIEEGRHVLTLQSALGTSAVAQPAINLGTAWPALATAAGITNASGYSPYASDGAFLTAAYVFEDVGVSAYLGAASQLTSASILEVAVGLLGVEAYHAGLIRTTLNYLDPTATAGYVTATGQISTLRAKLAKAAASTTANPYDTTPDDYGLVATTVSLAGAAAVPATRVTDADATNEIAFSRSTSQVLNIVTGGGAISGAGAAVSPALGLFFPAGMNGLFK
jgi:hypothetical protein